jgi:heavy metal efflux system protein
MFDYIIRFSIRNKVIIGLGVLTLIAWGVYSIRLLPIDAVPDITNNQVQVVTTSASLTAEDMERQVTAPVEVAMASIPDIVEIRSISRFGLSVVTIVFHDNVDVYWARSQVSQRLIDVQSEISGDASMPSLAPVTTGLGEIYQYILKVDPRYADSYSQADLRTLQDWTVRRRLRSTPGVADVSSFGGDLRQIEVAVDMEHLRSFGLSVAEVSTAIEANNGNAGSAYVQKEARIAYVRTEGRFRSMDEIGNIPLRTLPNGSPLRLRDIAEIRNGRAIRYGAMTVNAEGESVGGIVLMLKGANSSAVIEDVRKRVAEIQASLPAGITVEPFLDRSKLVDNAIGTVSTNLVEGALIVIFVLVLMLGNLRAGLVVASVIPLALLFAIGMMVLTGVSGNLMSLGALDFGLIVDAAVIIVEHVLHSLSIPQLGTRDEIVASASIRMRRSASIGELIILIVYVPILALSGVEGRMFIPMAQTVLFAIIGAFVLSLTWVPAISALVLRQRVHSKVSFADGFMVHVKRWYGVVRNSALRRPTLVLGLSGLTLILTIFAFLNMGGEFLPQLDEGDFAVEVRMPVGTSVDETARVMMEAASILRGRFTEIQRVIGKVGTSEIPLDPMPMSSGDMMIILKDRADWLVADNREDLAIKMQQALTELPGVEFSFQQPIQMRFNELMTGARQDVAVKIFGDNFDTLSTLAKRLATIASSVRGAVELYVEPIEGLPQLVATVDRDACARAGVNVVDLNNAVRSFIAGQQAGVFFEEERRFEIVVRIDHNTADQEEIFRRLPIPTADNTTVPLNLVAEITTRTGPNQIQRDDTRRRITVGFNTSGRDVKSIVEELQTKMNDKLHLPSGYYTTVGGQFENLATAQQRLSIVVPASLAIIVVLLYITFRSITDTFIIFTAVPLAIVGGVIALLLRNMPFSISAGVGFIALFGVAVLNGIVLISAFHHVPSSGNILRAVIRGTVDRLRPVLMTATVASLGFLPMALSTSSGAEVQKPLATVVIGGLVSSTVLTLVVLPVLYLIVHSRDFRKGTKAGVMATLVFCMGLAVMPANAQDTIVQAVTRHEARDLARRMHIDIRQAQSIVEQQKAVAGVSSIDLGKTSVMYLAGQYNSSATDNNVTIQQTIPFPMSWFSDAALAERRIDVARSGLRLTENAVDLEIERLFERIAYLRLVDSTLQEHERLLVRMVEASTLRENVGEGTRMARIMAESQRKEIVIRRQQTNIDLRNVQNRLKVMCGANVQAVPTPLQALELPREHTSIPVIDYLGSKAKEAGAEADVAYNKLWPDITFGWFSQTMIGTPLAKGTSSNRDRFTGVSLGIQFPLWFADDLGRAQQATLAERMAHDRVAAETRIVAARMLAQEAELDATRNTLEFYRESALPEANLLLAQSTRSWEAGEIGYIEHHVALARAFSVRAAFYDAILRHNILTLEYQYFALP